MPLTIKQVTVYQLAMHLKTPFKTAHDVTWQRPLSLLKVTFTNGIEGFGEVASFADAAYTAETHAISLATLAQLIPASIGLTIDAPQAFATWLAPQTAWSFAKAALEMAIWDGFGKLNQQSLTTMLGGRGVTVKVGIALGVADSEQQLQKDVAAAVAQGYQRIKLKLNPTTPLAWLQQIVAAHPTILFSADANASWTPADMAKIQALDQAGFYLLEQPFGADAWQAHFALQKKLPQLKISLDESLNNLADVKTAIAGPVGALTLKQGKLGGITATANAIELANTTGILPWIGGMLSSGIGRAADLALATLPNANIFPSDSSASERYFEQDIIMEQPQIIAGNLPVPTQPGLGITINWSAVAQLLVGQKEYN